MDSNIGNNESGDTLFTIKSTIGSKISLASTMKTKTGHNIPLATTTIDTVLLLIKTKDG